MKNIGLLGFGVVGQGFYQIFTQKQPKNFTIKRVAAKNPSKKRNDLQAPLEFEALEVVNDPSIQIVVEATNDENAAYNLVKTALLNGKSVVSANKQLLAKNLKELTEIANNNGVSLLFEGAVGGVIPIVQNVKNYIGNDNVSELKAIINGSSNYILTQVFENGKSYSEALGEAQLKGFAESDPTTDVNGSDAAAKLSLLSSLIGKGVFTKQNIATSGIQNLDLIDIAFARQNNLKIKQIASLKFINEEIQAYVLPSFINTRSELYNISNEFNAVSLRSEFSGELTFIGRGAGKFPTGFAVYNDVLKLTSSTLPKQEIEKGIQLANAQLNIYLRWKNYEINPERFGFEKIKQIDFSTILAKISSQDLLKFVSNPISDDAVIIEASVLLKTKREFISEEILSIH
ncbi:MAG: homoserine dehydrogenase [Bacteroidia bacterium]